MKDRNDYLKLNVYQIYPKSFKDGNNDGIGDLKGIISKIDYLKDLGINAIWICPIYVSPQDDNGYDIANYFEIDPMFGTMDDFKLLVKKLHHNKMKLIMDFVANHTSTSNPWFKESRKKEINKYSSYYYWVDTPTPINSIFGGSAWQYDEVKEKYYLHCFAKSQADLNWDNPDVRKDMRNVLEYWVKLGVDGFRCDVIDLISKDLDKGIIGNGPSLHKYIKELFDGLNVFTVGECGSRDINEIKDKIGPNRGELTTLFQFDHFDVTRCDKFIKGEAKLYKYKEVLAKWCNLFQENDLIYTLFTDNHDQSFMVSRLGNNDYYYESATCIASMTYLLRGIPFIYQGIEFGSKNSHYEKIDDFDDIESINYYNEQIKVLPKEEVIERINFGGRDNARRPLAWNGNINGGFSENAPWIKLSTNLSEINLAKDINSEKSIFNYYKAILGLRKKYNAFSIGKFKDLSIDNTKFIFERSYKNERFIIICNYECECKIDNLGINDYEIVLSNYGRLDLNESLKPYEVIIIKVGK